MKEYTQPVALARAFLDLLARRKPCYIANGECMSPIEVVARTSCGERQHVFPKGLLNSYSFRHCEYNSPRHQEKKLQPCQYGLPFATRSAQQDYARELRCFPGKTSMSLFSSLVAFGFRQVLGEDIDNVLEATQRHFRDHSQTLPRALDHAHQRAWQALAVALAGDSLLNRLTGFFASGDDKGVREQVRLFLDASAASFEQTPDELRQACLEELKSLRKSVLLSGKELSADEIARQAAGFQRYSSSQGMVEGARLAMSRVAEQLRGDYPNLARLLQTPTPAGPPLLAAAFAYFFRREVETDDELAHGLFFDGLRQLSASQARGLGEINKALGTLGERFDDVFDKLRGIEDTVGQVKATTKAIHGAVLDLQGEMQRLAGLHLSSGAEVRALFEQVLQQLSVLGMQRGEVQSRHSFSIRGEEERRLVRTLLSRFRQLPGDEQHRVPALLNGLGKLQVGAGDFEGAKQTFVEVADAVADPGGKAEAHFNAYRAALEQRKWDEALAAIRQASELDAQRFAPFPLRRYQPRRILGAGGFGAAFLCHDDNFGEEVVVKALHTAELARGVNELFKEARILRGLSHRAIIGARDCDYADSDQSRPYLVLDYFAGSTLQQWVDEHGPLSLKQTLAVAVQIAEGMRAAHAQGVLHRDLKPANILVRQEGDNWQVKVIDFGLALRRTLRETQAASAATLTGSSIAGTLDYAAPEQMGKLPGVSVGPVSDVYSFGRTCCYALFQTPQPLPSHWRSIPDPLVELLEACLEEKPDRRPRDFAAVLKQLGDDAPPPPPPPPPPLPPPPPPLTPEERLKELEKLAQEVAGCTSCSGLVASRTQTVFGAGPLDPKVLFLGEAPADDEDRQGHPFVGAAGQLLMELLAEVGLRREEVYLTNMIKCRPPGNRTPQAEELRSCRGYLDRQLELIRPRFICTLGPTAAQALFGSELSIRLSISRYRGKPQKYLGIPVICTYDPGRSPEKRPQVTTDLQMLLRHMGPSVPGG